MAVYQRSDVPFANNLFTIPFSPGYWNQALLSNLSTLIPLVFGGTLTNPTISLPDGSAATLQGSFTVTGGPFVYNISGTITGLARTTGGQTIETVSGVSLPFTAHVDVLVPGNTVVTALTAEDIINGNDQVTGGSQDDTLMGFGGTDTIQGAGGNDTLIGGPGTDTLNGGTGSDTASYVSAIAGITARLDLGFGQDDGGAFDTYTSIENVTGSDFADVIVGKAGEANILSGGSDNDTFIGEGIDTINGGDGNDVFFGGQGSALNINLATSSVETVWGSFVGDVMDGSTATANLTMVGQGLTGGANADTMTGGSGNDFIYFRAGDVISGGTGNDWAVATLSASGVTLNMTATGFENAWGSTSNDNITAAGAMTSVVIVGDTGNDTLTGGTAGDFLYGFGDNDILTGGGGNDNLIGGAGTDTFAFGANWGTDIVWDWVNSSEKFNMQGSGATTFADLTVNQNYLASGNALISFGTNKILVVGGANLIDSGDFLF